MNKFKVGRFTLSRRQFAGIVSMSAWFLALNGGAQTDLIVTSRHAPALNGPGRIEGSVQQSIGENVTLNGGFAITGDLQVPGTPNVRINGNSTFSGTIAGSDSATPTGYQVTLNGGVSLRYLRTRTAAVPLPTLLPPPAPTGNRLVTIHSAGGAVGDPVTLGGLTLNGNVGQIAVPPGTYGNFAANGGSGFTLGVMGAVAPSIYNLQSLTLNGQARLEVVGPIILTVARGFTANGLLGTTNQSSWLQLQLASGGFTLNGGCTVHGSVVAPAGTVILNGNSCLIGSVKSDRLIINGNGCIKAGAAGFNQPPVAEPREIALDEDTTTPVTLTATDPEGAPLVYTLLAQPTRGSLSGAAPDLFYTPGPNESGDDSFTFKVNDGAQDSATATVFITIAAINDTPIAKSQSIRISEDTPAPITLLGLDVEGNALIYFVAAQPQHGILINFAPDLVYLPDPDYQGADSFMFRVNDGVIDSALATVEITVSPLNDRPVASPQSLSGDEDAALPITLTGEDIDDEPLNYAILTAPSHGMLIGTAPNLTYLPATNYNGLDSFTFEVSDGMTNSLIATISLTIRPINDRPIACPTNFATIEDTATNIAVSASDIEDASLTYMVIDYPTHGSLTGAGTNLVYSPGADYHGADSFTFRASDGTLDSEIVTVSIIITLVNDTPVADARTIVTDEDLSAPITLTANDVDGDSLTFTVLTPPDHGTLSGTGPDLTYTPANDYRGVDGFSYIASDAATNSEPAIVTITVNPVNDPPVSDSQSLLIDEDTTLPVTLTGTDVEGDTLTFAVISTPLFGTVDGAPPNLTYTPYAEFHGTDSIIYIASDGYADSDPAIVFIDVLPVNDAPVVTSQTGGTLEDLAVEISLDGTDVDGDLLSFILLTPPRHGTVVLHTQSSNAGLAVYTPAPNYHGFDSFTFASADGLETSPPGLVTITVEAVNDAPVADAGLVETGRETPVNIVLTGSDADGDEVTFLIVTPPEHGSLTGTLPNLTYIPANAFFGADSFAYVANDGEVNSAPGTVTITVAQGESGDFSVEAGSDQVVISTPVVLAGTVAIPEPLPGKTTNVQWLKTGGPGTVEFTSPAAFATGATFSEPGTYVLRLRVTYDGRERSDSLTVAVLPPAPDRLTAARSSRGTDFWLTFLDNASSWAEPVHSGLSFVIAAETNTTGMVSFESFGERRTNYFQVQAGTTTVVPILDYWNDPTLAYSDAIQDNAIHISTAHEVTVHALNYLDYSSDGYLALPAALLGTEYVVLGYKNSPNLDDPTRPVGGTQFAIVGSENETQVTITPTITTGPREAGVPYQITLQQGQTYRLMNADSLTGDLSGTTVSADKPIAVFGGHRCAIVPEGVYACDHLVEQLPPVNLWGRQFVTMPLATRSGGDTFRILAMTNDTLIAVNGQVVARLERGQFHERTNAGPTQIIGSQPVLVAQYANGSEFDGSTGDPFMMLVPPAEQFGGSYTLSTPQLYDYWESRYADIFTNYLNLTIRAGGVGTVQLDGAPVAASLFQPIGNSGYVGAQIPATRGAHRLTADVPFGVSLYGWARFESYAYIGGIYSESVEADTRLTLRQPSTHALVGSEKVVIARVTNGRERPLASVEVTFNVIGANGGIRRVRTNPSGEALIAYSGSNPGEEIIQAVVAGLQRSVTNTWIQYSENLPPAVDPGANRLVALDQVVHLAAMVSDDGKPAGETLTYKWRTVAGLAPARFTNPDQPATDVSFDFRGIYQLELTVSDSMFSVRSNVSVTVNDQPRILDLWSHPSEQPYSVGQEVILLARVSDADGSVTNVEFFAGETSLGEAGPPDAEGIATIHWIIPQSGTYPISVVATDNLGGATHSASVAIQAVSLPIVEWLNPTNGYEAIAGIPLQLEIRAIDLDGTVTDVSFIVDYYTPSYNRAEFSGQGAAPNFRGSWTPPRAGNYYFHAYAWDNDGVAGVATVHLQAKASVPSINLVSPTNGETVAVGELVVLEAEASVLEPDQLSVVEFFVNARLLSSRTNPPFAALWTPDEPGAYSIIARVQTVSGSQAQSDPMEVISLPSIGVSIDRPHADSMLPLGSNGVVTVALDDSANILEQVILLVDGIEAARTNGVQLIWQPTSPGNHVLQVEARDRFGSNYWSSPVPVRVVESAAPGVQITSPNDQQFFIANDPIEIVVAASDADGPVRSVELRADGSQLVETNVGSFAFRWIDASPGLHELEATVTDETGQAASSTPVWIFVERETVGQAGSPANLLATSSSPGEVMLTWAGVSAVELSGYAVERKASTDNHWREVGVVPPGETTFDESGLDAESFYRYRVAALIGTNNQAGLYAETSVTTRSVLRGYGVFDLTEAINASGNVAAAATARSAMFVAASASPVDRGPYTVFGISEANEVLLARADGTHLLWWPGGVEAITDVGFRAVSISRSGVVLGTLESPDLGPDGTPILVPKAVRWDRTNGFVDLSGDIRQYREPVSHAPLSARTLSPTPS